VRVAVDARYGLMLNRRGVGVATYHLLRALGDLAPEGIEILAFGDDRADPSVVREVERGPVSVFKLSAKPFAVWEQWAFPKAARRHGSDLIHSLANVGPLRASQPMVLTVHDVIEWHRGRHFPGRLSLRHHLSRLYRMNTMIRNVRSARAIHTVSQHAADDICQTLRVPPEKVHVIPLGFANRPVEPDPSILTEWKLVPHSYAMAFGALDPRKNMGLLMRLWASYPMPLKLVVVGLEEPALKEWAAYGESNPNVVIRGFESDARVLALMKNASLFLYPSFYEGFGLPVLEALSLGVPVIVSRGTSSEEVARGCALTVDAFDTQGWKQAVDTLAHDEVLRRRLAVKGQLVAASYSWMKMAEALVDIYRTLA
jgi:glycosyltransferase involved in cell wall biosynthesis